ncbi:LysR family substrate-binding domain-containing protein [Streptomyces canus]|uniref:LysR family substrate-binding domain-containing protein n=1 Tax=Streptomyces canus TaxID=58343 RepID=UPI00048BF747|nr:LysR family substrate-binding domain-containing protein [Streptomyces canus]
MTDSPEPPSFRLAYVPGVTPAKWVRIWTERFPGIRLELVQVAPAEASDVLRDGGADAGLVRLPVDRTVFSAIPLYAETSVVVVPKDHVMTAVEEVTVEDLADEVVVHPLDDVIGWERPPGEPAFERPATTADAIELVAANIGVLVVPQSLARLHHRRDLTYRPLTDAPQSEIALAWREDATTDMVEDFIGIVRGRTVNSSRGRTKAEPERGQRPEKGGGRKPAGAGKGTARGTSGAGKGVRGGSGRSGGSGGSKGAGARRGKPKRRG